MIVKSFANEIGVFSGLAVNRLHGIESFSTSNGPIIFGLPGGCADEFRVGFIAVLAECFAEFDQTLSIPAG